MRSHEDDGGGADYADRYHADHADGDDGGVFTLPTAPSGKWDALTSNEQAWIEFIRVISCGSNPKVTLKRVTALMALLDAG